SGSWPDMRGRFRAPPERSAETGWSMSYRVPSRRPQHFFPLSSTGRKATSITTDTGRKNMEIAELVKAQRTYFETDATKDVAFRVAALTRLRQEILRREKQLLHALQEDLGKAPAEGYMTEVGMV